MNKMKKKKKKKKNKSLIQFVNDLPGRFLFFSSVCVRACVRAYVCACMSLGACFTRDHWFSHAESTAKVISGRVPNAR